MEDIAFQTWLPKAHEEFESVQERLTNVPFYERTNEFVCEMEVRLQKLRTEIGEFKPENSELRFQITIISALLQYTSGRVFTVCGQKAADYFKSAWEIIEADCFHPCCVLLSIYILSELSCWSARMKRFNETEIYWLQVRTLYDKLVFQERSCITSLSDLFLITDAEQVKQYSKLPIFKSLSELVAHTYPGSMFNCWWDYTSLVLSGKAILVSWMHILTELSTFLILTEKFCDARHILSCASQKGVEREEYLIKTFGTKDPNIQKQADLINAGFSLCWVLYAGHLLKCSKNSLMKIESIPLIANDDLINDYGTLPEDKVKEFESRVPCILATTFEEARQIFLFGTMHLKIYEAFRSFKYFYKSHIQDQIALMRKVNNLYAPFAYFEYDLFSKYKLYESSTNALRNVLEHQEVWHFPEFCKELLFAIGEDYFFQAQAMFGLAERSENTSRDESNVQLLAVKVIKMCEMVFTILNVDKTQISTTYSKDAEYALFTWIRLAAGYTLIFLSNNKDFESEQKANKIFDDIIQYFKRNPEHGMFLCGNALKGNNILIELPKSLKDRIDENGKHTLFL